MVVGNGLTEVRCDTLILLMGQVKHRGQGLHKNETIFQTFALLGPENVFYFPGTKSNCQENFVDNMFMVFSSMIDSEKTLQADVAHSL